jgi:hypothetical protein
MDKQPTPTVTSDDVERIVRRDFPQDEFATAMNILNEYGIERGGHERPRVQLAVLKLAKGALKELRLQIEAAKCDYRDVLAAAEYPTYTKIWSWRGKMPAEEKQQIFESDWNQYANWLRGEP